MMQLFFNYSIDCELPANTDYTGPERRPFFHGPATWDAAEASVRGFVDRMHELGAADGAGLFVYPDVAQHQSKLYREMADSGIEIGLHLNGLRYSRLRGDDAKWLGEMNRDQQHRALSMAKADLEDAIERPVHGYRACYGSSNHDTFGLCEDVGFTWTSNASTRYRPEFFANWTGSFRYPHHTSRKSKLICGDMDLFEVPVTTGIDVFFDESIRQPLDLRSETPPKRLGPDRAKLRAVIDENIVRMQRCDIPVRAICGASHNTNPFGDRTTHQSQNVGWVVRHTKELAGEHDMAFTPASFETMRQYALQVESY